MKKKDYYKKTKELFRQFRAEEYKTPPATIWHLMMKYVNSAVRLKKLKRLNAPNVILKNGHKMVTKHKQKIIDRITLWLKYNFQFEQDYKKEHKVKEPLIWKDYFSAEEKLLYSIFKNIDITEL